ncbi:MAG: type I-C CRISPR-associated protein Cas5c [candidate division Zixibacteria bacterium]|nr:type I-C CRISPR-associated protein Cas5c [candidate division Zixibacteria bacterium]MBU1471512.1 type I-C CRISPR-associated protein Cas5c [candidate division Zixibacteria bacterium]MBU2626543.1 type I-C CRISPR-associated protein Cas5c [candidate division Zixibacteria bacterium]
MAFGVKLKVWGDYACFTRPEMKVERVSYDVMTPSAARAVLEAVYWKPSIRWVVDRIHVLNPIRFMNIRRNEVASKIPLKNVTAAMKDPHASLALFIEDDRQQRVAMVLRDVCYGIEAHFDYTGDEDKSDGKHLDMFNRRAREGQCFTQPYLGCREFSANFEPVDEFPPSPLTGKQDLGWMLHEIDFANDMEARFFRAEMVDGIIDVPLFVREVVKT